ncbi:MAG: hypothetical protein HY232_09530 [Acidobacteria bacterium]|nr:hypothetical protein [Acidobacteriota bacterium]
MITDTEVKMKGVKALTESLGSVDAERFIALIQREPFDYTKWQRTLWEGESVEEISRSAMKLYETMPNKPLPRTAKRRR